MAGSVELNANLDVATTAHNKWSFWDKINPCRGLAGPCKVEKFIKSRGLKIFCVVAAVSLAAVFCPHVVVGLAGVLAIKALFAKIIIAAAPFAMAGAYSLGSYLKHKYDAITPPPSPKSLEPVYHGL
jgi:hypothetical protein